MTLSINPNVIALPNPGGIKCVAKYAECGATTVKWHIRMDRPI
jgi:hypothetical protein